MFSYLQIVLGHIQCDTAFGFVSVLQIAEQTNNRVQENNWNHGHVNDSKSAGELFRLCHLIFDGHHLQNINHVIYEVPRTIYYENYQ